MSYDQNNIFARIVRGEIPCKKIYEDSYALAFHDIQPRAKIHVLVVPKGPYQTMDEFGSKASSEEITGFYRAVASVVEQLGLKEAGLRTIANTGLHGGQEVPHFHLHLLGGQPLGPMVSAA